MSEKVVVAVNEGKIRGVKEISKFSNVEYIAFYGIPYAEPPIKNSRFKDPVKIKPWKNIHDGTKEKPGCSQLSFLKGLHLWGTEDCLFNNVYTRRLPQKDEPLRPVIVNIHGGAYHTGTPHTKHYGSPEFVIQHDIVYICISYRLHVLGFLNLGLKDCSGNQGIKDIIMSLHWIKDNVRSFGGDPENITLLGASSGASTIHLLMLSPAIEKNLFHKAVLMSGYLTNPIAPYQETNETDAREIVKLLGYESNLDDRKKILNYLKKKTPEQLINCLLLYIESNTSKKVAPITALCPFSPNIDPYILPCSPQKLIESMIRIPIMIGFCERESAMGFTRSEVIEQTHEHFTTTFCQNCWGWGRNLGTNDIKEINRRAELFYAGGNPILKAPLSLQVDVQSDICMSDVYDTLINVIAAHLPSSVFVYKFEFEGKLQTIKDIVSSEEQLPGTYHGSEYIHWNRFDWNNAIGLRDERTRKMVNTFTKLVTTFAKTGEPNYDDLDILWKPSTVENPCYLIIDEPMKMVEGRLNKERLKFWDEIKNQFKNPNDESINF